MHAVNRVVNRNVGHGHRVPTFLAHITMWVDIHSICVSIGINYMYGRVSDLVCAILLKATKKKRVSVNFTPAQ